MATTAAVEHEIQLLVEFIKTLGKESMHMSSVLPQLSHSVPVLIFVYMHLCE